MFQPFRLGNNSQLKRKLSLRRLRHYSSGNLLNRIVEHFITTYCVTLPLWLNVKHPSQTKVLTRPVKGLNMKGSNYRNYPSRLFKVCFSPGCIEVILASMVAPFGSDGFLSGFFGFRLTKCIMSRIYASVSRKRAGRRRLADNMAVHLLSGRTFPFCCRNYAASVHYWKNRLFPFFLFSPCWPYRLLM